MTLEQAAETMFRDFTRKKLQLYEYFFEAFFVILLLVILLVTLAFAFFPDFTLLTRNFCDMREIREIDGESTLISFTLFMPAIFLLFISLMAFFIIQTTFFKERKLTKYLSWVAASFGIIQCPLNLTIFLERGTFEFHTIFMITGPLSLNLAVMFLTAVYFIDKRPPKISKYLFLTLSIVAIVFAILEGVAVSIGGTFNHHFDRLGNTLFQYFMISIFIAQGVVFYFMTIRTKGIMVEDI